MRGAYLLQPCSAADSLLHKDPALCAICVPCCSLGGATDPSKPAAPQFLRLSPIITRLQNKNHVGTAKICIDKCKINRFPLPTFKHFDSNSLACWHLVNPERRGLHHLPKSPVAQSFSWGGEKVFDKRESLRASHPSDWEFPVSQARELKHPCTLILIFFRRFLTSSCFQQVFELINCCKISYIINHRAAGAAPVCLNSILKSSSSHRTGGIITSFHDQ